jgi:hypothetical protein
MHLSPLVNSRVAGEWTPDHLRKDLVVGIHTTSIDLAFVDSSERTETLYACLGLRLAFVVDLVGQKFAAGCLLIHRRLAVE